MASVEITDHSAEAIAAMKEKVEQAWAGVGETAAARAADVAPVDTGRLKNSISWATEHYDGGRDADSTPLERPEPNKCYIGTNVEYAAYQEFGTSRGITGKHFLEFGANSTFGDYAKQMLENMLKG